MNAARVVQAASRGVAVHPTALPVSQDRSCFAVVDGAFDRALHGWGQRCQDDPVALAVHLEHAVAVLLAQILDAGAAGLEDPQAEQTKYGHEGEVVMLTLFRPA